MQKINVGLLVPVIVFIFSVIGIYAVRNTDYQNSGFVPVGFAETLILCFIGFLSMISALISLFISKKNQEPQIPSKGYLVAKKVLLVLFVVMLLFFAYSFKKFF